MGSNAETKTLKRKWRWYYTMREVHTIRSNQKNLFLKTESTKVIEIGVYKQCSRTD